MATVRSAERTAPTNPPRFPPLTGANFQALRDDPVLDRCFAHIDASYMVRNRKIHVTLHAFSGTRAWSAGRTVTGCWRAGSRGF